MLLEKFTSRSAEDILIDLNALKLRERNGEKIEQPLISLLFGTNRAPVKGYLVDMKNESKEKRAVIKSEKDNTVSFIEMYLVMGVIIHDADKIAPLLIELTSDDVSELETVTKLGVKKQVADETANLISNFGTMSISFDEELSANPSELFFAKLFLIDVSMCLITIGKTDEGKQAIQEEIKFIRIKRGVDLAVCLEEKTMLVQFPFNQSFTTNKKRNVLFDKIYNIL